MTFDGDDMSPQQVSIMTDDGINRLRRGDAQGARVVFDALTAAAQGDVASYLGLAYACRALADIPAALAAVDAALALEPMNLRALMLKGHLLEVRGDPTAAAVFYQAVVKCAPSDAQMPPELRQLVAEARAKAESRAQQLGKSLEAQLASLASGVQSRRFSQSLDILLGRCEVFVQQPRLYYFPELPQIQFFDRESFPWLDRVEAATAEIRAEMLQVLADRQAFTPYVKRDPARPALSLGGMLENADWSAFYLWKNGVPIAENLARCPRTVQALAEIPFPQLPGCSPSILFSQLRPGARIPAHTGIVNTRLICHLPLVVPPGCGFRVGNETREWVEGKAWIFDDTMEHEAWNTSEETRVILLFEVWRPELTEVEREWVAAMFAAIARIRGEGAGWDDQ